MKLFLYISAQLAILIIMGVVVRSMTFYKPTPQKINFAGCMECPRE